MAMMLIMFSQAAVAQRMSHQIDSNAASIVSPFAFGQGAQTPGMEWFKDAKFGMFMHWGPIAQWGAEISFPLMCTALPCHPKGPNNTVMNITTTDQLREHRQVY